MHAPDIVRGLVATETGKGGLHTALSRYLAMRYAHPDFLAYDVRDLPSAFVARVRNKGFPVTSWTVRTDKQWQAVHAYADAPIYEEQGE